MSSGFGDLDGWGINLKLLNNITLVLFLTFQPSAWLWALDPLVIATSMRKGSVDLQIRFVEKGGDIYKSNSTSDVVVPLLGNWSEAGVDLSVATLGRDLNGKPVIRDLFAGTVADLGAGYYVLAGGDFEGSGRSSVAIAQGFSRNGGVNWRIIGDPLEAYNVYLVPTFGKRGDVPFYFRGSSQRDTLAVLRWSRNNRFKKVEGLDVLSGARAEIILQDAITDVVKVAGINLRGGIGGIFIQTSEDYRVYSLTGHLLFWGNYSVESRGHVAIGDYLSVDGDEIAFLNSEQKLVMLTNPYEGKFHNLKVDQITTKTTLYDRSTGLRLSYF